MLKLKPYLDHLKTKFLKMFKPTTETSYDESIVDYYVRHSCKQFLGGKPLRFRYKFWALNSTEGYLIDF